MPIATISSIELVELINSLRPDGKAELRHDNFMVKIENHPGIASPKFLGHVEVSVGNGATRKSKCYHLPKREAELMVMSESLEVQAKVYDRLTELEARVTAPTPVTLTHSYTDALAGMEVVARMLHLEGAAALGLIRKATALTAPHLLPALPVYAIDAPRKEDGELVNAAGSEVTVALSTLLKKHGSSMSAVKGNKTLQQLGYLEQRTRPSSCGTEERKFWAVSKAGLKFGKNVTSPANPKEVQPHWYERTGAELVRLLESI